MPYADPVKQKQYQHDYHQRPEVKAKANLSTQKYYKTERGKMTRRKHLESPQGRTHVNTKQVPYNYKRKFGITLEEKAALLAAQGHRCKACGSHHPGNKLGQWQTDHIHGTKIIRGILCLGCNSALGHVKDNPQRLRQLADYVEEFGVGSRL